MKQGYVLALVAIMSIFQLQAQNFDQVSLAIKTGNAKELLKSFGTKVEMTILDEEATYSKAQAEMVLKKFFNEHKPINFEIIHNGLSDLGSKYIIGNLVTEKGNYRTYLYARSSGGNSFIQEIRFEQE